MPGLGELLRELQRTHIHLGLVSNAQFFTPLTLSFFLNGAIATSDEAVCPFDPKLTVYSYRHLRAKPDPYLFELAREQLALYGVTPGQTLYLGNDMLNDIWAAAQVGFKTVLFAGDARSLRLRRDLDQIRNLSPDAVITELNQLLRLLL
jgi:putative hydrolase of the HAD superfamily